MSKAIRGPQKFHPISNSQKGGALAVWFRGGVVSEADREYGDYRDPGHSRVGGPVPETSQIFKPPNARI